MQPKRIAMLSAFLLAFLTGVAIADVPRCMNVQGGLFDASGNPVPAGPKEFTFRIFGNPDGIGGCFADSRAGKEK